MKNPIILCGVGDVLVPNVNKRKPELEKPNHELIKFLNTCYGPFEVCLCSECNSSGRLTYALEFNCQQELLDAGLMPEIVRNMYDKSNLPIKVRNGNVAAVIDHNLEAPYINEVKQCNLGAGLFQPHNIQGLSTRLGVGDLQYQAFTQG